jgi:hypothetical protein
LAFSLQDKAEMGMGFISIVNLVMIWNRKGRFCIRKGDFGGGSLILHKRRYLPEKE